MSYHLKRIVWAVVSRKQWLLAALFPPLVFLVMSVVEADRFLVRQEVALKADRALTPRDVHPLFSATPFFDRVDGAYPILSASPTRTVYFRMDGLSTVSIVYEGLDPSNGTDLVSHYATRLKRSLAERGEELGIDEGGTVVAAMTVSGQHALWRSERLTPLLRYFWISLAVVFLALVVLEYNDPSLKTERAAARYTGIPMLGSLPDMEALLQKVGGHGAESHAHEQSAHPSGGAHSMALHGAGGRMSLEPPKEL